MNMERLTKRDKHGFAHYPYCFEKCDGDGTGIRCQTCDFEEKICNKLADYEDLEEQGLLLKLPCKVGDVVYQTDSAGTVFESKITKIIYDTNGIAFDESAIGKTVFLTEQEAQAELEKMKGE